MLEALNTVAAASLEVDGALGDCGDNGDGSGDKTAGSGDCAGSSGGCSGITGIGGGFPSFPGCVHRRAIIHRCSNALGARGSISSAAQYVLRAPCRPTISTAS